MVLCGTKALIDSMGKILSFHFDVAGDFSLSLMDAHTDFNKVLFPTPFVPINVVTCPKTAVNMMSFNMDIFVHSPQNERFFT